MATNEFDTDTTYVALLAIELHDAGCYRAVAQLCDDLPPMTDMRIHVALKALAAKLVKYEDLVDPSIIITDFSANFAATSPPSSGDLLQQVLAVLSSPLTASYQDYSQNPAPPAQQATDLRQGDLPPPPLVSASDNDNVSPLPKGGNPRPKSSFSPHKKVLSAILLALVSVLTAASAIILFTSESSENPQSPSQQGSVAPTTSRPVTTPPTTQPPPATSTTNTPSTRPTAPPTTLASTTTFASTIPPLLIHQEIAEHPYFAALVGFSFEDALLMQRNSAYGSPAWAYGRHLAQGFRADARTANATTQIRESATAQAEFCINSSCFAIDGVVPIPTQIFDFSLGGKNLSATTRGWKGDGPQQCAGRAQFCVPDQSVMVELTSIHQVGSSSFVTVEIKNGSDLRLQLDHVATSVVGPLGRIPASVQVGGRINSGEEGVWLYRFSDTPLDAISTLEVTTVSNGQEFTWRLER